MGKTYRGKGKDKAKKAAQARATRRAGKCAAAGCLALLGALFALLAGCKTAGTAAEAFDETKWELQTNETVKAQNYYSCKQPSNK